MTTLLVLLVLLVLVLVLVRGSYSPAHAQTLVLPDVIDSHMVLPSMNGTQPRLWGNLSFDNGVPIATKVSLSLYLEHFQDFPIYTAIVSASASGEWMFDAIPSIAPSTQTYGITLSTQTDVIKLTDIVFGVVYFCGGQSNMELGVNEAFGARETIDDAANYPFLRLFTVNKTVASTPQNTTISRFPAGSTSWLTSAPSSVNGSYTDASFSFYGYFSAVCYYAGRAIYADLGGETPIGLIESCWSGTPIQPWTSPWGIRQCVNASSSSSSSSSSSLPSFDDMSADADLTNLYKGQPTNDSVLWNSMVSPLINYPIHGVFWYQGESNAGDPTAYECQFPAMIRDWRRQWQLMFDFYFVQLSGYSPNSTSLAFPELRQAQLSGLKEPNVYLAAAYDIGDAHSPWGTVHPQNKSEVGRRLSLLAMRNQFNDSSVIDHGPRIDMVTWLSQNGSNGYDTYVIDLSVPSSDPASAELELKGTATCTTCCTPGTGWMVVGNVASNQWYPADATVDAASFTITVQASVPSSVPVDTVRFAFQSFPECAIISAVTQLPLLPFSITVGKEEEEEEAYAYAYASSGSDGSNNDVQVAQQRR